MLHLIFVCPKFFTAFVVFTDKFHVGLTSTYPRNRTSEYADNSCQYEYFIPLVNLKSKEIVILTFCQNDGTYLGFFL